MIDHTSVVNVDVRETHVNLLEEWVVSEAVFEAVLCIVSESVMVLVKRGNVLPGLVLLAGSARAGSPRGRPLTEQ